MAADRVALDGTQIGKVQCHALDSFNEWVILNRVRRMNTNAARESRNATARAVAALRQSAIIANSAVDSMNRAAAASNPEKLLRCWTAQMIVAARAQKAGK